MIESYCYDKIDFSIINNKNNKNVIKDNSIYDNTTCETYRVKRLFKIDPLSDELIPDNLKFGFKFSWNPYNGIRNKYDKIGPLYFNAINLYDYYYINRYKGLWNKPDGQYQGYYGELIGTGKNIEIKSRGINPEKYLYRLPIIDCYLPINHNLSIITMGPELTDNEISEIDEIIINFHPKKSQKNFASLTLLKYYYDRALDITPDPQCDEITEIKKKYVGQKLSEKEINEKYNRYWVDELVKINYT